MSDNHHNLLTITGRELSSLTPCQISKRIQALHKMAKTVGPVDVEVLERVYAKTFSIVSLHEGGYVMPTAASKDRLTNLAMALQQDVNAGLARKAELAKLEPVKF